MRQAEFRDARLVAVYDAAYQWSRDDEFFLAIVNETPSARVLDLGCGTGRLTTALAAAGHRVTGVDPAEASLVAARAKPAAAQVTWIEGSSAMLPNRSFDVAVMTSHVAQFFVDDAAWAVALADLQRALVPGGRLIFDTRNPTAQAWQRWNPSDTRRLLALPDGQIVETWTVATAVTGGVVTFTHHYVFGQGERLLSTASLRFRNEDEIRTSLRQAGFVVESIYGGWQRQPVGDGDDGELLVVARV